jgi:hypothetical protein
MEDTSLVTWKCGSTDEETLLLLGANAITVIRSENMEDALTPYMPLPRKLLKGLLGLGVGVKNRCFPTYQQLRERWSIMLDAYKERTRVKSSRPNYNDATMWRQMSLSYSSSDKAPTYGRHISAEVCMLATRNVFKDAIAQLLLKGYLDIQLGFTATDTCYTSEPSVEEVPLKTPSGEVLGLVWHVKGAISRGWQQNYWRRLDGLAFAKYPGAGECIIRIAAEDIDNVFLLGRQNDRVLESVALSDLEIEFLKMVELVMDEQKKIIKMHVTSNALLENVNVYWKGDMVQTTIGRITSAGFGDHDDLSVLLCDDRVWARRASNDILMRGEDVQTATLVPSDAREDDVPVYVVWSTEINNKKVELARIRTGPFDFHFQGHLIQKRSMHAVKVETSAARMCGANKCTRGAMFARLTGPFQ